MYPQKNNQQSPLSHPNWAGIGSIATQLLHCKVHWILLLSAPQEDRLKVSVTGSKIAWNAAFGSSPTPTAVAAPPVYGPTSPNTGPLDAHAASVARVRERVESFEEDKEPPLGAATGAIDV